MKPLRISDMVDVQDQRISEAVVREQDRLRNFIRRRVPDRRDAEDILQDVFSELVEAYRLMRPVEQVSAWLFRVARNRITDLFRKRGPEALSREPASSGEEGEGLNWENLLPSPRRRSRGGLLPSHPHGRTRCRVGRAS